MSSARSSSRFEAGPLLAAAGVVGVLLAVSGRYGYHRDELYFLAAGRHLAWGYPDQPPFVPALARLMSSIAPGSLPVLRLPSALAAGADVLITARIAREFGAGRGGRALAAVAMATAPFVLGSGHLLSTATFGLLAWTVALWLVVRILRTGNHRLLVVLGLVAGVGLLDNDLIAFLLGAIAVGAVICGPRGIFRSPWLWVGVVVAVALWTPYLVWQAQNGWPELTVARSIASGGSGTSTPRWVLVPFQLVLANVWLTPVWVVGLWRLLRGADMRWARAVGVAWVVLVVVFTATGAKAYYLTGMLSVLLAAGAEPTVAWARGQGGRFRGWMLVAAVGTVAALPITLPLIPVSDLHSTPVVAVNYDAGEQVAWPVYVGQIMAAAGRANASGGSGAVILTSNYGEAGAVERYAHVTAYSGQNGFWWWGPPPGRRSDTVVAVGLDPALLHRWFAHVDLATRLNNHLRIDDDEQGVHVWICTGQSADWPSLWPRVKDLG